MSIEDSIQAFKWAINTLEKEIESFVQTNNITDEQGEYIRFHLEECKTNYELDVEDE